MLFIQLQKKRNYWATATNPQLSTKRMDDKVEIRVKDNGIGIPQKAIDKIFQPFFTTKPTGQGNRIRFVSGL